MLEKLIKHHKILALIIFGFFYAIFFYLVSESMRDSEPIDDEKPRMEQEIEAYETMVFLEIEQNETKNTYTKKLLSIDNFEDLLEQLREEGSLSYEVRAYSNGTRISEINGVKNSDKFEWKLYIDESNEEILDVLNTDITKNVTFKLKFTRI